MATGGNGERVANITCAGALLYDLFGEAFFCVSVCVCSAFLLMLYRFTRTRPMA